jgi:hypothetical protein
MKISFVQYENQLATYFQFKSQVTIPFLMTHSGLSHRIRSEMKFSLSNLVVCEFV